MNNKINVAIDGPSGSGKSTVAKEIAKKYGLNYINTGSVYRAIALNAINQNVDLDENYEVLASITDGMIQLLPGEVVKLKGEDVTKTLRSDEVSQAASKVAAIEAIRIWAVQLQKHYGVEKGVVMDGRDTTFKILPEAEVKIFLDTSPEVRASRRVEQNKKLGYNTNIDEIIKEITIRDERDRNREIDPLHKTEDARLIDASNMTIQEVVDTISIDIDKIIKR